MEQKLPGIEQLEQQEKKTSAAVNILKWGVLAIVIALASAAVFASVQYSRVVTTTQKGTVVDLTDTDGISPGTMEWLRKAFPDALIRYNVDLDGLLVACDETSLILSDEQGVSAERLIDAASELTRISSLDLTGLSLTFEEYEQLRESYPDAQIKWTVPVLDGLSPDVTVMSVRDMASLRELAAAKEWLPALIRVDMTGTPLTTEELRELSAEAPFYGFDVDWNIIVCGQNCDYDTTSVTLSGAHITDLTELYRLPKLSELTLDGVSISDLSPLLSITTLESITLKNMEVDGIGVLGNMYWLGSFFVKNTNVSQDQLNDLQDSLPECIIMRIS